MLYKDKGANSDAVMPVFEEPAVVKTDFKSERTPVDESVETPQAGTPSAPQIRSLNLRVPAPSPLLPFEKGHWRPSEQYRTLRTKIGQHPLQPNLIVFSSPDSGDGKSVTSINTAAALALNKDGQVLLVDADLRRSTVHGQLGLPESPGLSEVLSGASTLEGALVHIREFPNLHVLTAGVAPINPVELLDSDRWRELCQRLRGMFRYVIIDSPPVGAVADYELIQAVCDGVILVLRPDFTNRHLCQVAMDFVPQDKFLGVLLNCVPDWSPSRYAGASSYYYGGEKA
jgi:capsular exopolysaccharide synthesis family protein